MSQKTIFQQIIDREIPANIVFEDDRCLAFHDVAPQAPIHVLVIPKSPIASVAAIEDPHRITSLTYGWSFAILARAKLGNGYRVVVNCGPDGGQSVDHLHFHLLGGRQMTWPPG